MTLDPGLTIEQVGDFGLTNNYSEPLWSDPARARNYRYVASRWPDASSSTDLMHSDEKFWRQRILGKPANFTPVGTTVSCFDGSPVSDLFRNNSTKNGTACNRSAVTQTVRSGR